MTIQARYCNQFPKIKMQSTILSRYLVYLISLLAAICSFYFYGPINYYFFNSDQAIHVLMLNNFEWPADAYYWGQNRLGSFLPILALPFYKLFHAHPLWILGILNYTFLLVSFWILQKYIKSLWGNLVLLAILFFPHPSYYYILLIGHPYAAQIFCLSLSIHFFILFTNAFLESFTNPTSREYSYGVSFIAFSFLSIWINELSAMVYLGFFLFLYPLVIGSDRFFNYLLKERKSLLKLWVYAIGSLVLGVLFIVYTKAYAYSDPSYGRIFITTLSTIIEQGGYLGNQLLNIVLLRNHHSIFQCVFYFSFTISVVLILKKKGTDVLFKTLLISSILLFFVYWNYRSHFDVKYYIPIYVAAFAWIAYHLNSFSQVKQGVLFLAIAIPLFLSNTDYISITRSDKSTLGMYDQANLIPAGVAYGEYWDVYRLSGATAGRIQGVSNNDWDFRNRHKLDSLKMFDRWFFYSKNLPDSLKQIGSEQVVLTDIKVRNTGKQYILMSDTLIEFTKLGSGPNNLK
ncbi:MAG: hypothetical protein CFE21_06260 [Bacteroidetes bacterium B1(2017)]|nr:MAG: hypothetical protein CFE21_06260 [Bacteroidetes bacterium B1(2017)]